MAEHSQHRKANTAADRRVLRPHVPNGIEASDAPSLRRGLASINGKRLNHIRTRLILETDPRSAAGAHGPQQVSQLERRLGIADPLWPDVGDAVAIGVSAVRPRLPREVG